MDDFKNKDFYRLIFEHSMDAILLTNPDGEIFLANPAACELFQMNEAQICALGRLGIVDVNDGRLVSALQTRAMNGKVRAELNFVKKNGEVFTSDTTSTIFKDDNGREWTVITIRDISLSKKEAEQEKRFAYFDYLTGIFNRRALIDNLQQEMARAKREKTSLCLMMIDIDYFKEVNDQLGHQCGDRVLRVFAKFLVINVRTYDIVGRYGGDEFIVCLPNTDIDTAYMVAQRLLKKTRDLNIKCSKKTIKITLSIGLVAYNGDSSDNIDTLISRVDKNMYYAKQTRDTVYR